jgi:hypothetical protein
MRSLSGAIVLLAGAVLFGAGCITEGLLAVGNGYTSAGRFALGGGVILGFIGLLMLVASIGDRDRGEPPRRGQEQLR